MSEVYGFSSKEFPEPAFNRVVFHRPPKEPGKVVRDLVTEFRDSGIAPALFIPESPEYAPTSEAALALGLRQADRFLVMVLENPRIDKDEATTVREIAREEAGEWSLAYLQAFYGDDTLLDPVARCVGRALGSNDNRLLLAYRGGESAGTVALHAGGGFVGVYCLGTVPAMRGKGVASSLLRVALQQAEESRTKVMLQTFEADGVERFYLQRGFVRAFAQGVFLAP